MSNRIWVTSDHHFGHSRICEFTAPDGVTPLRPWDDVEKMNESLVASWNEVVGDDDTVIHLGDLCFGHDAYYRYIPWLKGRKKILVRGNHDLLKLSDYAKYFDNVVGVYRPKKHNVVLTHVPIHPDSLGRWKRNICGHLHAHKVLDNDRNPDHRYRCVSVEQTNYQPVELAQVLEEMREAEKS